MEIQTESLMKSASRSFIKSLMKILGLSVGLGIVLFLFSGLMGKDLVPQASVPTLLPDAQGNRKLLPMHTPALCVLRIDDVIGLGDLTSEKFKELLLDSRTGIFDNNRLKGILLYVNTPGGTVIDSDNIYQMLMQYKKDFKVPIYAFVNGYCASGGMYIASSCDKIYATTMSEIGSVGVRFGPAFNVTQTMDKYGVSALTFTQGKDKDMLNPFRPWGPTEGAPLEPIISAMYDRFTSVVLQARTKMSKDALVEDYGAHMFLANDAQTKGYIDEANATYESTIADLANASGIPEGDAYQVIELSTPHTFVDQFSQAKMENVFRSITGLPSKELQGKLLFM